MPLSLVNFNTIILGLSSAKLVMGYECETVFELSPSIPGGLVFNCLYRSMALCSL